MSEMCFGSPLDGPRTKVNLLGKLSEEKTWLLLALGEGAINSEGFAVESEERDGKSVASLKNVRAEKAEAQVVERDRLLTEFMTAAQLALDQSDCSGECASDEHCGNRKLYLACKAMDALKGAK